MGGCRQLMLLLRVLHQTRGFFHPQVPATRLVPAR
jgi:hypothetical protein